MFLGSHRVSQYKRRAKACLHFPVAGIRVMEAHRKCHVFGRTHCGANVRQAISNQLLYDYYIHILSFLVFYVFDATGFLLNVYLLVHVLPTVYLLVAYFKTKIYLKGSLFIV